MYQFQTTTNDPLILGLVTQYKAALAELETQREKVLIFPAGSDGWEQATDELIERGKEVNQIEVVLCAAFVRGLELSKK
ncbi:MAG: hypothetical protein LCI00_05455 [Chloroflexi bacterium]|nr:hypothetical protein [Chloroflexota bacterium]